MEQPSSLPPRLRELLAALDTAAVCTVADLLMLYRDHPAWAVWRPRGTAVWTAVRPASIRPPEPGAPMAWAHGQTAQELAARMRAADDQIPGH
jgi:hypothetical protein